MKTMKYIYILIIVLLVTIVGYAQVPQGISYQAIAFDGGNNPVVSSNVGLQISILDTSVTGTAVYVETHTAMTNSQGLFNLNIGQGTPTTGTFATIDWATNNKFLKVELDPAGGTSYTSVGANQLMTVPYAMMAGGVTNTSGDSLNSIIQGNKSANFGLVDTYSSTAYVFNSETGVWSSQSFGGGSPSLVGLNGNFGFIDTYTSIVYVFNSTNGTWNLQSFGGGTPTLEVNDGSFGFVDTYTSTTYAFSIETGSWTSQSFGGGSPTLIGSNSNFGFIDTYASIAYAFNNDTGTWSSQSFGGGSPTLIGGNGNFGFVDTYTSTAYTFSKITGVWSSQSFGGGSPTLISSEIN